MTQSAAQGSESLTPARERAALPTSTWLRTRTRPGSSKGSRWVRDRPPVPQASAHHRLSQLPLSGEHALLPLTDRNTEAYDNREREGKKLQDTATPQGKGTCLVSTVAWPEIKGRLATNSGPSTHHPPPVSANTPGETPAAGGHPRGPPTPPRVRQRATPGRRGVRQNPGDRAHGSYSSETEARSCPRPSNGSVLHEGPLHGAWAAS